MHILLLGAGGFIGRHILAELLAHGHSVRAVVRTRGTLPAAFPQAEFVAIDLATATSVEGWRAAVAGIDVVINAAGLLKGRDMRAVHVDGPAALYAAAIMSGVRRVVLISAISARADVATDYARSKRAGEQALIASGLGWTILRPSLVYGDGSYGGTSLLRGMAGLPAIVPLPGDGGQLFSPIHAADLAMAVRRTCEAPAFAGAMLEPCGPETLSLRAIVTSYRAWLGFGRARFLAVPMPVMLALGSLGDLFGDGPISRTSLAQLVAGNDGDGAGFARAIGFAPRTLGHALAVRPAQVQDRWHARLFFLAPLLKAVLVALWLASALLGFMTGGDQARAVTLALGLPIGWADSLRIGGSLLDLAMAALLLIDAPARRSTIAQLIVVIGYTLVIGIALPGLWLDPLGPLIKNVPILVAILCHGAIGDRR